MLSFQVPWVLLSVVKYPNGYHVWYVHGAWEIEVELLKKILSLSRNFYIAYIDVCDYAKQWQQDEK